MQWVSVFNHENSGTYNSQFLVVDYKLFEAGAAVLKPGLFWVLEQYPGPLATFTLPRHCLFGHRRRLAAFAGGVSARDVTDTLAQQRYFGSYNVPYLDETYEVRALRRPCDEASLLVAHALPSWDGTLTSLSRVLPPSTFIDM